MKIDSPQSKESGQSLVETVVMLPVLLFLFLGLFYFSSMIRMRMQALEAVRYLTWEQVWNVRDQGGDSRDPKELKDLHKELTELKLDAGLLQVGRAQRSMSDYSDQVKESDVSLDPPQFVKDIFQLQGGNDFSSGLNDIAGPLSDLVDFAGKPATFVMDFMANQTQWTPEVDKAVYTSAVSYRFHGAGPFQKLPSIKIIEFSSMLNHPLNIARTNNDKEYEALVGSTDISLCKNQGHIFDLWLFPSGPFFSGDIGQGISTVLNGGKCFISEITNIFSAFEVVGIDIGFKLPDGTLKEFPELHNENGGSD